jgi:putative DNA primase/helicase
MNASAAGRLKPDRGTVEAFLGAMFAHADPSSFLALRAFDDRRQIARAVIVDSIRVGANALLDRVCARISEAANHAKPLVFCPPVATFIDGAKARTEDLANGVALSVECDRSPNEALARLTSVLGPPTITVASGGEWENPSTGEIEPRLHLHWRLAVPTRTAAEHLLLREARELATSLVGADATGIAVVHPFRWPGSWHCKATPRLARIVSATENELLLDDALDALREAVRPNGGRQRANANHFGVGRRGLEAELQDIAAALDAIPNADLPWDEWNRIGMATWVASSGQAFAEFDAWSRKSSKYDPVATSARWDHYPSSPPGRIGAGTLFYLAGQAVPGWRKRSAGTGSRQGEGSRPGAPNAESARGRSIIRIVAGDIPRIADQAEAALRHAGVPIFVRAGCLVRPVTETMPAAKGRTTTTAKLRELCCDTMVELLSSSADFERFDGRKGGWVRVDPPNRITSVMLVREGRWTFPRVAGVVTTPTLRADGSVLATPGYDPGTRLFLALDEALRMPSLPDAPTREEAEAALRLLSELLSEFPFASRIDRAVALSGLITAVVRGALPVAPMHVIRAHTPGTGKSLLVDVASTIATGRPCPVIAAGKTAEETEKRLGALLRDGVPIVSIDNVAGELGGDMLCQMTERPLVRIRILGRSEAPEFECRATVFATGNNLILLGDMTRRAILCSLDADVERPELRTFAFDPIGRVLRDRGAYVAAALTIVRAYKAAGSPEVCAAIGSYGAWSDAVRSPLVWLGEADPVASMETARGEDPELLSVRELFGHWREQLTVNEGYTANRIIQVACAKAGLGGEFTVPEFRDVLLRIAGDGGAVSSRRLGKWLSRISGRIVDGYRVSMKADNSHGSRFTLSEAHTLCTR